MAKGKARISNTESVRIGAVTYKKGDEKKLMKQISPERAEELVKRKVLHGDWSGAEGRAEKEARQARRRRAERHPMGRLLRDLQDGDEEEEEQPRRGRQTTDEEDSFDTTAKPEDPNLERAALPIKATGGEGGWYSFADANDEEILTHDGSTYQVRGQDEAEAFVNQTNG